ncbi:MAG: holo-ACP synthase [Candidatus Uhrbacteria bacterium]|nr:holo-ACP synthase [Candidatus Uhrbacteria bacterium]
MMALGMDIVAVKRFKGIKDNPLKLEKIFTENEIAYCLSKAVCQESFAGHFAAKEATIKAFSSFGKKLSLKHVEITHSSDGGPFVHIKDSPEYEIMVSIAHEKEYAVASALVIKK